MTVDGLFQESFLEVGLCHETVCRILKKKLRVRKTAAYWVPHNLTKVQKWHRFAIGGLHLDRYHNEWDALLQRIAALDKTWTWVYELNDKHHKGSPQLKKVRKEHCRVKFITYDKVSSLVILYLQAKMST